MAGEALVVQTSGAVGALEEAFAAEKVQEDGPVTGETEVAGAVEVEEDEVVTIHHNGILHLAASFTT